MICKVPSITLVSKVRHAMDSPPRSREVLAGHRQPTAIYATIVQLSKVPLRRALVTATSSGTPFPLGSNHRVAESLPAALTCSLFVHSAKKTPSRHVPFALLAAT